MSGENIPELKTYWSEKKLPYSKKWALFFVCQKSGRSLACIRGAARFCFCKVQELFKFLPVEILFFCAWRCTGKFDFPSESFVALPPSVCVQGNVSGVPVGSKALNEGCEFCRFRMAIVIDVKGSWFISGARKL
jgi:hypothetical protein